MKKFMFTRLTSQENGYGFYIPADGEIGPLYDVLIDDMIDGRKKLLALQKDRGVVTFGVQENLPKRDGAGRLICNFIGYRYTDDTLEASDFVPFYDCLSDKFSEIEQEVMDCHDRLDKDRNAGKSMQVPEVIFGRGVPNLAIDWDKVVSKLDMLKDGYYVFDKSGTLSFKQIAEKAPDPESKPKDIREVPAPSTALQSDVRLDEKDKTIVPDFLQASAEKPEKNNWSIKKLLKEVPKYLGLNQK